MRPEDIRIADYTYELPDDRIAKYPLAERDASKLLVYRDGAISEDVYRHFDRHIAPDAMLVFNNTRVIPARVLFNLPSGAAIELFCLSPEGELNTGLLATGEATWLCLVGGAKKWKSGPLQRTLAQGADAISLEAELLEKTGDHFRVRFCWTPASVTFAEVLTLAGQVPLPPYLHRPAEELDRERYQTIYARHDGSVAAPTAGLHYTETLLDRLREKNVSCEYLTLHVGAGTFRPVKSETIGDHEMHAEYFDVSAEFIQSLLDGHGERQVIAVGTTSLRTLESLFLMGSKLLEQRGLSLEALQISQWDAYQGRLGQTSVTAALEALLTWMEERGMDRLIAPTQLLIAPGYRIRTVDALATNFHQPSSTLLLLVAAAVGGDWREIYRYALDNDFRFLSYGDGSLLFL